MAEFTLSLNSESLSLLNNNEYHQLNDLEDLIDEYIDDNNNNNEFNYCNSYNNGFDYCNKKVNIWCDNNNNNNICHEFYPTTHQYDANNNNNANDEILYDIEKDTEEDYERYVPDYLDQNEIIDDTIVDEQQQQQQQQLKLQFNFNATDNLESNKTFDINNDDNNNSNNKNTDQATKLIKNIENIKGLWDQPRVLFNRVLSMQFGGDDDFESPYFTQDESDQIESYLIEMSNKTN